jgi:catechol 2,3-dioxygenase-like lactoylglutathione lyase family enzyme
MRAGFLTSNTILYCRKWDQTVHFYRDLLALPVLFENDWFVEFELNSASRLSIADERRTSIKSNNGTGITLPLEVVEIDTCRNEMKHAGLNPASIRMHPWHARVFYIFDPEGHRIEIWQKCADTPEMVSTNENLV